MSERQWIGGNGRWSDAANWTTTKGAAGAPGPGDTLKVTSGNPLLTADGQNRYYDSYDNESIDLSDGTSLTLDHVNFGQFMVISANSDFTLKVEGDTLFNGDIEDSDSDAVVTIAGPSSGSDALVIGPDANIAKLSLSLTGNIVLETRGSSYITNLGGTTNDGDVTVFGTKVEIDGNLSGKGAWQIEQGAALSVHGSVSASETVNFAGRGGELKIVDPTTFGGAVTNFGSGDFLDFANIEKATVDYDAPHNAIIVSGIDSSGNAKTVSLNDISFVNGTSPAAGQLQVASDGEGGSIVQYSGAWSIDDARRSGNAVSVRADVANQLSMPGTSQKIDGTGITVGVISDGNEGKAMEQIVQSIAPGAKVIVADAGNGISDMAGVVNTLAGEKCDIIVDDIGWDEESAFSTSTSLDQAISSFIADGGDYFTAASNSGAQDYKQDFIAGPSLQLKAGDFANRLPSSIEANNFDNGTQYLTVSSSDGSDTDVDISWDAPWTGVDGRGAPEALKAALLDSNGNVVAVSNQNYELGKPVASTTLNFPADSGNQKYQLVVFSPSGGSAQLPFQIYSQDDEFDIVESSAGNGSGTSAGHASQLEVNVVAATDYGNSPAFGRTPDFTEEFSSYGPGLISYGPDGKPYSTPVSPGTPDFTAADGSSETVDGYKPFFGTSAAAPTAAGVAALMLQADGNLTPSEVTTLLKNSAIKLTHTADAQQGAGLIQADVAVRSALAAVTPPTPAPIGPTVSITPTQGDDSLTGTVGNDTIAGLGGNDTIDGVAGNDLLFGNQGNDVISDGGGNSTILGGMGNDSITVGNGSNLLYGGEGADTIRAGNGNNTILGGTGNAAIDSMDGADLILSGSGNDFILGNGGDDTIASGAGNDTAVGGFGNDVILGNQGDDFILGNQGDDTLVGGQGNDTLVGGQGNDVLYGGQGDDVLYGNEGLNTFVFNPGDTDFKSGAGTGDTVMDFVSGKDRLDFASGPAGSASDFGTASTTAKDFASIQALAQTLIDGGDAYAFVADGTDGYLFATGGTGTTIADAVKLAGAGTQTSLRYQDITPSPIA